LNGCTALGGRYFNLKVAISRKRCETGPQLGLDRYQYSVSVSGRYQWYRSGIGIADTTPILVGRCLLTIHSQQEMKQRRRRLKGATDLHLPLYTEAALPIHPPPLTVGRNGRRTAMSMCGTWSFEWGGWIAAARQSQDESSPCSLICACRVTVIV